MKLDALLFCKNPVFYVDCDLNYTANVCIVGLDLSGVWNQDWFR